MKKILVALSGGIDSAATALILKEQGYDVTGVTFDLTGDPASIMSARSLSERLGINLLTEDARERFGNEIIRYFIDSYMKGETPAPCSLCNPSVKWRTLKAVADREGFPLFATGHYIRIVEDNGRLYVARGIDPAKDQSYYLWGLDQETLRRAVTPLGPLTKNEVRAKMSEAGFSDLAAKKESMSVCFLKGTTYHDFLRERIPEIDKYAGGDVIDNMGSIIGRHNGYPFYTVGQKRGFELFDGKEKYITGIDPSGNRLIAGDAGELYTDRLLVGSLAAADIDRLLCSREVSVMIRGFGWNPKGFCKLSINKNGKLSVITDEAVYAPAKGQPVVFYIGDMVVGGGILEKSGNI